MDTLCIVLAEARSRKELPEPPICRLIRERAGLTQAELGRALAVDRVTVNRWENGRRSPRGQLRLAYLQALGAMSREA